MAPSPIATIDELPHEAGRHAIIRTGWEKLNAGLVRPTDRSNPGGNFRFLIPARWSRFRPLRFASSWQERNFKLPNRGALSRDG